jgi:leucyl/phenylalanyl-tRNA--protein transferase
MQQLPPSQYIFPDPIEADPEGHGFICIGADLSPSTLFEAYTHGLFPWFNRDEPICWWSLNHAALLTLKLINQASL